MPLFSASQRKQRTARAQRRRESARVLAGANAVWQRYQAPIVLLGAVLLAAIFFGASLVLASIQTQGGIDQARELLQQGKAAWAVEELERITVAHPKNGMAWVTLGQAYLQVDALEKAEQAFQTAMALQMEENAEDENATPETPMAFLVKGRLAQVQGDFSTGEATLLKGMERYPGFSALKIALFELYIAEAEAKLAAKRFDASFEALESARQLVEDAEQDMQLQALNFEAHQAKLAALAKTGEQAQADYLKSLLETYRHPEFLWRLAQFEEKAGRWPAALAAMEEAYTLAPQRYALSYANLLTRALNQPKIAENADLKQRLKGQSTALEARLKAANATPQKGLPYPLKTELKQLEAKIINEKVGEWQPQLVLAFHNARPSETIPPFRVQVQLLSGDVVLTQRFSKPLPALGESQKQGAAHVYALPFTETFLPQQLEKGTLRYRVFVTFEAVRPAGKWFRVLRGEKQILGLEWMEGDAFPWEPPAPV